MAQGTVKPKKGSAPIATRGKATQGPKKGARVVAPKKSVLVRSAKITKVCSHAFQTLMPCTFTDAVSKNWDL